MVNKVILIGRVGKDPEIRYVANGTAVANFSIATTEYTSKDKDKKEYTEWHKIQAWSKLAEICAEYLKRGSIVYVEGSLKTRSWDDKDGSKKYSTEVVIKTMNMLDSRKQKENDIDNDEGEQEFAGIDAFQDELDF